MSKPADKMFRFGDEDRAKHKLCITVPAQIDEIKCNIVIEVVESDKLLLLDKPSLKRAKTVLDLPIMFDKPVVLDLTSTGHYCIAIANTEKKQNRSMCRAEAANLHETAWTLEHHFSQRYFFERQGENIRSKATTCKAIQTIWSCFSRKN